MLKIFFIGLGLISFLLYGNDKQTVLEAYKKLSQTYSYTDSNGKQVSVRKIAYRCKSKGCSLIADGKEIPPEWVLGKDFEPKAKQEPEEKIEAKGEEPENMKGMTLAHNEYRRQLGIPDLVWDENVAAYAQEWASQLKRKGCILQHRQPNKYGENIAGASGQQLTPKLVVKMWYTEVENYNYSNNSCKPGKVCGHYTQVVWKNSKRLGCGYAYCGNSEVWVCNYDPPGNYIGEKPY